MINVRNAYNQAKKLNDSADKIDSVIKQYEEALNELKQNNSSSASNFSNEISSSIEELKKYKKSLTSIAARIRTKSQEIKEQEQKKENEK